MNKFQENIQYFVVYQNQVFSYNHSRLFVYKDLYSSQFLRNHQLLRTEFQYKVVASFDLDLIKRTSTALNHPNAWQNNLLTLEDKHDSANAEKLSFIYLALCLLSIYEIDKNQSHFYFVSLFFLNFLKKLGIK